MTNMNMQEYSTEQDIINHTILEHPSKLFVETTTRCNLGCLMCVKQTAGCEMHEEDMNPETFSALTPALPHLETLILNGIGEPLLNPHLETFIRTAKSLMPKTGRVGFQSNGLLLTDARAASLLEAGLDRICLSIDAASPELFQTLREGGHLSDIERALAAIVTAKRLCGRPDVAIGIEYVVMRKNLTELPAALRWAAAHGAAFAIVTHVLPYEEQHAGEAAYTLCTAEAVELFRQYSAIAHQHGLNISNYFESRWKYSRSKDEQKLVDIVETMKAEAARRELFIDMKKLLLMDIRQADEVADVFARAREVACESGIELRLPEIALLGKRHCSFVEEGSAFVSVNGNVSPCYFLWHRYRCYASGWRQQVVPKVFGNVTEQDVLQIWNSQAYGAFRAQVSSYDYPGCSNCTLAPCDYVQTDAFEQDCHIGEVPCGACLWCTGVFQCMQ
ncbi:MAG: radical SAM/SPASM family putative metalloenzyme maturase [Desulfuromonadales bacterium]